MRRLLLACSVLLTLAAAARAAAERPLYDDRFFVPVEEVVTPHIPWAKPYATPPKVLFITHREAMREVVELAQRLGMDYDVFAMQGPRKFGETGLGVDASWRLIRGNSAEEMTERLLKLLANRYDVIVCGNIKYDELPIACRYEILKQVKGGTGLVGSVSAKDEYLGQLLKGADFSWTWATWVGAAQGVADYFGTGEFSGAVDYSGGHGGQAALKITCAAVGKGSREAARAGYHSPAVTLEPGAEYVFSCWARTDGLKAGGASVSLHPLGGLAIPPSAQWQYSETRFTAKPGADGKAPQIHAYLLCYQPGTVWYDDVKLVKAGTDDNLLPNAGFEQPGPAPVELVEGFPYQHLPQFAKYADQAAFLRGALQTTSFRAGRIGLLTYPIPVHQMLTPGPSGPVQYCRGEYDYLQALAVKLILWGARKSPQVSVVSPATALAAGKPATLAVTLRSAAVTPGAQVVLTAVGPYYEPAAPPLRQTVNLQQGGNTVSFALPALPAGNCYANCRVLNGEKVIGFGSVALAVASPLRLTGLTLQQDSFSLGQPLAGELACEGGATGAQVRLRARDTRGRLLAEQTIPLSGGKTTFSLPMPRMLTIIGWLTAELRSGGQTVDVRRTDFSVNNLYAPRDDVQFVMWMGYPNDFVGPTMAEQFSRGGVDAFYDGGSLGYGPYANQWWLPYATRYVDQKTDWYQEKPQRDPGDLVRDPCLNDPKFREQARETLAKCASRGLKYSTSDFTLGDENHFVAGKWDLCFSDYCNADFQRWARQSYGTLEKLNAEWGSSFASWAEVKPQTLQQCQKTGNYVPWIDHRLHMDATWAGVHDWSREVIRETVPHARVGYEGSDTEATTWASDDYYQLARAMSLNNIYYRDFLSLAVRDFSTSDTLLGGGWFGGYAGNRNEPFMRWFPWRTLLKGSNSFWVWCGYGNEGSVMAFDTSLYPFFQSACEEIAEIKGGIGKLLMASQRANDGIALLWSSSSVHVGTATPGFPDMDGALGSMVKILHDCGLEAKVLSYADLAAGKLTNKDFKVLLLPLSQALSAAEVEQVKRFVSAGGTLVADVRPGVADEHGKPCATPTLDEVFGVTQAAAYKGQEGKLAVSAASETGGAGLALDHAQGDAGLALKGGRALGTLGEAPAAVVNKFGEGRALLLNFTLRGYLSLPAAENVEFAGWAEGAPYRQFVGGVLKAAGVTPRVTVAPDAPQVEVSRFAGLAGAEYVGLVQGLPLPSIRYTNREVAAPAARAVTIEFGRKSFLYDVRAGKYLGEAATLKTRMTPGVAQLYALLPYKPAKVALQAPAQARAGAALAYTVKLAVPPQPAGHVVRVRVFGPDGKERPWYAQNLLTDQGPAAETGRADGSIQFALDDAAGTWKIVARDVATGLTGATTVAVK